MPRRKAYEPDKTRTFAARMSKAHTRILTALFQIEGETGQERIRTIIKDAIGEQWAGYVANGLPTFEKIALMSDEQFEKFVSTIEAEEQEEPAPVKRRRIRVAA